MSRSGAVHQFSQIGAKLILCASLLPTRFYGPKAAQKFPASRLGQIVSKILIYSIFLTMRGVFFRQRTELFPADMEMRWGLT